MNIPARQILRRTSSVCPSCLKVVAATVYEKAGEGVYMYKMCPDHGEFDVYVWPDASRYRWFQSFRFPTESRMPQTRNNRGCPEDCGICPSHKRGITLPEIEVTWRCNLSCPVCFMSDGEIPPDDSLEVITEMLGQICRFDGQNLPIQITGGEPTVRPDLDEIIARCREMNFSAVELNTNGLIIGRNRGFLRRLKQAGLTNVYLQFDGLDPNATLRLRGRDLLSTKLEAIENCRREGVPVILSVTLIRGLNEGGLGDLIRFSMDNLDAVGGLALQTAFESGRFAVPNPKHLSVGDVAELISAQSRGRIDFTDFWPVGSSHPLCYGSTYLVGKGDNYEPVTRHLKEEDLHRLSDGTSPQGAFFQDIVARMYEDGGAPEGLPILIMEYMDAWTMDLERAQSCNLAVTVNDGRSIPFCIYHLTDANGKRKHPHGGRKPNV